MKGLTANQRPEKQDPKCPVCSTHICAMPTGDWGESGVQGGAPQEQGWRQGSPGGGVHQDAGKARGGGRGEGEAGTWDGVGVGGVGSGIGGMTWSSQNTGCLFVPAPARCPLRMRTRL